MNLCFLVVSGLASGIKNCRITNHILVSDIRRYSDWSGYPGNNYNNYATGYGLLDDKYSTYNGGYNGYNAGFSGYSGYNGYASNGNGYGYKGYGGYDSGIGYGGQNTLASGGYGGYGGYGGNGGLTSYTGYNNPYYTGAYHLGYGYRKPGYGNIYNSGITPSLVTGYRGYSRR